MSKLSEAIKAELARIGRADANVAHVEAWVQVEHLGRRSFSRTALVGAVDIALACVDQNSAAENEAMREAVEARAERRRMRGAA